MKELNWGLVKNQDKLDAPVFANWQVAAYLEREVNQGKEGWPEVLGIWCQSYIDLITANTMLNCLADPKTLDRLLGETQENNRQSPLPPEARKRCHGVLLNLKTLANALRNSWESDREVMLKIVKAIRPAARERGIYAHLGYWQNGNILYVASGNGKASELTWDYKINTGWLKAIYIHVPNAQKDSFVPKYEVLTCETTERIARHTLDSVTGTLSDGTVVIDHRRDRGERFRDVSGIAFNSDVPGTGIDSSTHPRTLVALAIEDPAHARYVNYYTLNGDLQSTRVNTEPYLPDMTAIRCVYLPTTALPDDPDADALAGRSADQRAIVVYGGVLGRNQLHVMEWISSGTVEGPENWTDYNGIEVDPHYVWVFGKGGIACATHASMIKCKQGKIRRPSWIYHDFDKQFRRPAVTSLYPCADGMLVVSMLDEIYTPDYRIDRGANRVVTSSWVKRGGSAKQVIKMPIPCWSVLESLKASLERT
jgi:hypothetical protein